MGGRDAAVCKGETSRRRLVGGRSCALKIAAAAPERMAALVLIGTKAKHHPDPALHAGALAILEGGGVEQAWRILWQPLLSCSAEDRAIGEATRIALRQPPGRVARGVTAFHTSASRDQILASIPPDRSRDRWR
jgi:hypothetical protein